MDHFTRWIALVPLKNATSVEISEAFFKHWIRDFGVPQLVVMDSGSNFNSEFYVELSRHLGIDVHAFPGGAQYRNGRVERVHSMLGH